MFRSALSWIDPRKPGGVRPIHVIFGVPVAAIGAVLLALFIAGAFAVHVAYDAGYFRHHYGHDVRHTHPQLQVRSRAVAVPHVTLPSVVKLPLKFLPAVQDQDGVGACASYSATLSIDFAYDELHNRSWGKQVKFSPCYQYELDTCTGASCDDRGSYATDYVALAASPGEIRLRSYACPGPWRDTPPRARAASLPHTRLNVQMTALFNGNGGAGQAGVDAIKAALAQGEIVTIAIPVRSDTSFYGASPATQGWVTLPDPASGLAGGHEVTLYGYNDTLSYNGLVGEFDGRNQWAKWWGAQGDFHLPYAYVAQLAWSAYAVTLGPALPVSVPGPPPAPTRRTHATRPVPVKSWRRQPLPLPNFLPPALPRKRVSATSWYAHGVTLTTGQDVSGLVNSWGDRYHVWPVGLAAVIGTESGFNPYSERWAGGLDNSCGLTQEIIVNAAAYAGSSDARTICNWEESPSNSIYLGALLLNQYRAICGWDFAVLYACFNAGPGWPHSFYVNLTGQAYVNYFDNWIPNYQHALAHFQGAAKPKPQPVFPLAKWQAVTRSVSPYYPARSTRLGLGAAIWWNGYVGQCGGVTARGMWHARLGFESQRFQRCQITYWPQHPHWTPKVVRR